MKLLLCVVSVAAVVESVIAEPWPMEEGKQEPVSSVLRAADMKRSDYGNQPLYQGGNLYSGHSDAHGYGLGLNSGLGGFHQSYGSVPSYHAGYAMPNYGLNMPHSFGLPHPANYGPPMPQLYGLNKYGGILPEMITHNAPHSSYPGVHGSGYGVPQHKVPHYRTSDLVSFEDNAEEARSAYDPYAYNYEGYSHGYSHGYRPVEPHYSSAVGVFPHAPSAYSVPLLISCQPSIVRGSFKPVAQQEHNDNSYASPAYRDSSSMQMKNSQPSLKEETMKPTGKSAESTIKQNVEDVSKNQVDSHAELTFDKL